MIVWRMAMIRLLRFHGRGMLIPEAPTSAHESGHHAQGVGHAAPGRWASTHSTITSGAGVGPCDSPGVLLSASHAATCTARHGVGSNAVPVAFVAECSMPLT